MAAIGRLPSREPVAPADVSQEVLDQVLAKKGVSIDKGSIIYGGKTSVIYKGTFGDVPIAVKLLWVEEMVRLERYGDPEGEMITRMDCKGAEGVVQTMIQPWYQAKEWYVYPMELGRESLASYLLNRKEPKISEKKAKRWFRQIASGLDFMHSKKIAHLKVSLWTIVIDAKDKHRVFLVGLGQSKRKHERVERSKLPTSGLVAYWSPEMIPMVEFGDKKFDPYKADTWALGYCMFQSLTGESLWAANASAKEIAEEGHHLISRKIENWPRKHPNSPSPVVMDMLLKMMYYFEGPRLTMKKVLANPWFNNSA